MDLSRAPMYLWEMVWFIAVFFLLHLFEEKAQVWIMICLAVIAGLACLH
jgi:hypothetical protein